MFDALEKYKKKNHFYLLAKSDIQDVCNAPDKPGVYLVYSVTKSKKELVYIGYTKGEVAKKRQVAVGKKKASTIILQTLSEEIIKTCMPDENIGTSWCRKMEKEKITRLDVHWAVTVDKDIDDLPEDVQRVLMQKYIHTNGALPKWNVR